MFKLNDNLILFMAQIIDIHAHTSCRKLYGLCTDDASIEVIAQNMADNGIETTVLMPTYFPLKGTGVYNMDLLGRIKCRSGLKMFGSIDMTADVEAGLKELEQLASERKIIGIKLYPGYQDFRLLGDNAFKVYELASKFHLPVAVHTGSLHSCCNTKKCGTCRLEELEPLAHPFELEPAAKAFPNVNFIACHMSNPEFDALFEVMARYKNVYTDISGQLKTGSEEDIRDYRQFVSSQIQRFFNAYPERICFASDFPIQSVKTSLELAANIDFHGKEDLFFYRNAKRIMEI